jgi:hypothetical protein
MVQKAEEKTIWDKVGTIDYRYIYAFFLIIMVIPVISPIGIPVKIGPNAQNYYDAIMNLPKGSTILFHNWVDLSIWSDMGPVIIATFKILWTIPQEQDITIIMYQSYSDGFIKTHLLLNDPATCMPPQWRLDTYGETWVDMGYVPNYVSEMTLASFAADFMSIATVDYYGTPLMSMHAIQRVAAKGGDPNVLNMYDFDLFIWGSWGCTDPDVFVRQFWTAGNPAYHVPMLFMTIGNCVPNAMPYVGSDKPLISLIPGAGGAAELERIVGYKGDGTKMADITDLGGIGTLTFFILGNIAFFGKRFLEKKKE